MMWADITIAFLVALLFSILLAAPLRWRHPTRADAAWSAVLFLFFLMLVGVWAIGSWVAPVGPPLWGSYWLPFLIAGVVMTLIIAAVAPVNWRRGTGPPRHELAGEPADPAAAVAITLFGLFFWLAVIGLLALAIAGYFLRIS